MKRPKTHAFLALAACVSLGAIGATAQTGGSGDPIELFARMYPVFSHDRCTGCHGRVNPELERGNNHGAGYIPPDGQPCNDCHVPIRWQTRPDLRFLGKSVKQLCQMQSDFVHGMLAEGRATSLPNMVQMVNAEYISHLAQDTLIGAAFDGNRGGASMQVNKPPISRDEFVKAGKDWVAAGAGCSGWEGTITQTETFASSYSYPWADYPPPSNIEVHEKAQRIVTINRIEGETTIKISQGGRALIKRTAHMAGPNGPCKAIFTDTQDWTGQNDTEVEAKSRIEIAEDGSYTIFFVGPEEKTLTTRAGDMANDCGIRPMHSADSTVLDWPEWKHTIRCPSDFGICQKFDPDSKHLAGTATRTLISHEDAADRHSWLEVSEVGISRIDDGSQLPVKVKTTWDLTLEK